MSFYNNQIDLVKSTIAKIQPQMKIKIKKMINMKELTIINELCIKNHNLIFIYTIQGMALIWCVYKDECIRIPLSTRPERIFKWVKSFIDKLNHINYVMHELQECTICYSEAEDFYVCDSSCLNQFCEDCAKKMHNCPFCRHPITKLEKRIIITAQ